MRIADRDFIREIVVILFIKLLLLGALWWCFVRDARVPLDAGKVAAQLAADGSRPDAGGRHGQ